MTGQVTSGTERQNTWLQWGRILGVAGWVAFVAWALFFAYFLITKGWDGVPLGPMLLFAVAVPPMRWASDRMIKRGQAERA